MTVSNSLNKHTYVGNGVTIDFPYTFAIFKTTDIQVILTDIATGSDILLTTNYTVNVNDSTVRYPISGQPLSSLFKITLNRNIPITQETALPNGGPYLAKTIEKAFDKNIIIAQQLHANAERSIKLSPSIDPAVSTEFPAPVPTHFLRWNVDGTKIETTPGFSGKDSKSIDGGNASSVYLDKQTYDGGGANG